MALSRRAMLPSLERAKTLESGRDKMMTGASGIVPGGAFSQPITATPSPADSSRRSSGASGASSRTSYTSMMSSGSKVPQAPADLLEIGVNEAQTCWSNTLGGRKAETSEMNVSSPEKASSRHKERTMSDPISSASRGVSTGSRTALPIQGSSIRHDASRSISRTGSRTPTNGRIMPPLSKEQLQSAEQKLRQIETGGLSGGLEGTSVGSRSEPTRRLDRANSRTGWDGNEELRPTTPTTPHTPSDSKSKRPARQWLPNKTDPFQLGAEKGCSSSSEKTEKRKTEAPRKRREGSMDDTNTDVMKDARERDIHHKSKDLKKSLKRGSRDDSFLSTISESTVSSDSTDVDKKGGDGEIEIYSADQAGDRKRPKDVLKDFHHLFHGQGHSEKDGERMYQLLQHECFDKPLAMQRLIIPVIMNAFEAEQKGFVTVQGAPQSGKTSALALGILGAISSEMPGIRAICLSTGPKREFKKCFDICSEVHPIGLACFEGVKRKVSFAGVDADPVLGINLIEDMQNLCSEIDTGAPGIIYGHPSRVLPLLREAPAWGVDLSNVQVLALDDAEDSICQGLMDEVCEVCTILSHFSKQRLRYIILSHVLSQESKSMMRCLRTSLLKQSNLFGIQAHRTQARAKNVNHYYAVAAKSRWPAMLAVLHNALSLPSGIIFDDESADSRARTRVSLRSLGVTASVWSSLAEQRSGARAAARDGQASNAKGPAFHLMPSDLAVLKVDVPQVRCILHFAVPRRELGIYGARLMCLEQEDKKKTNKKSGGGLGSKSLSVLFVEEVEIVREIEKAFHIRMNEVPLDMIPQR